MAVGLRGAVLSWSERRDGFVPEKKKHEIQGSHNRALPPSVAWPGLMHGGVHNDQAPGDCCRIDQRLHMTYDRGFRREIYDEVALHQIAKNTKEGSCV